MSKNIDEVLNPTMYHYTTFGSLKGKCIHQTEVAEIKQAILADLLSVIPTRWETPKRRSYETDRQIGYNDALKEVEAAIKNYIKGE